MPTVLITPEAMRKKPAPYVDMFREANFEIRYPVESMFARGLMGDEKTIEELQGCDAVIASGECYTPAVLDALPKLRVIARAGVGYDKVNVPSATAHNIPVTITPTSNHEAVAELTMALLFAVAKNIVSNDKQVRQGNWPRILPQPIRTKTFGILGLGRIGRSTALRAAALGMKVIATESYPNEQFVAEQKIELVELDDLLARSDFISVHCPLNDETRGLFNKETFAKMKQGASFLNTARGGLVVETDLCEALNSGHLRGAGLDVFEQEPPSADNPLFQMDNVVVNPHLAGTDEFSMEGMGVEAADCIVKLQSGQWPEGAVVNNELKEGWKW